MRPIITVSYRVFPSCLYPLPHSHPPLAGIPPRRTHHGIVLVPHSSLSHSRGHPYPAIQRDRQPARIHMVTDLPPKSPALKPLGYPSWTWALQPLPVSDRGAKVVGRINENSDARHGKGKVSSPECLSPIPLVMSYVPRLLPQYRDRDHCRLDDAANECELTLSTYRKWHRLVFPHEVRTTTRLQVVMCQDRLCRVYLPDARH